MNIFGGKSEQEKAMGSLVHDTNRDLSGLSSSIQVLEMLIKDKNYDAMAEVIERMKLKKKSLENAIDKYYEEFTNDFKPHN